jgi:hypothetical protein
MTITDPKGGFVPDIRMNGHLVVAGYQVQLRETLCNPEAIDQSINARKGMEIFECCFI